MTRARPLAEDSPPTRTTRPTKEETDMGTSDLIQYAHALYAAHGDKAEAEAAQKATAAEASGDAAEALKWRKVRGHIKELRGPKST